MPTPILCSPLGNKPLYITSQWKDPARKGHWGIDISAATGTALYAPCDAIIEKITPYKNYTPDPNKPGWVIPGTGDAEGITLKLLPSGLQGIKEFDKIGFGHLQAGCLKALGLSEGQQVKAGQLVGLANNTGWSTGPHLHLNVYKNGGRVDPGEFLKYCTNTPSPAAFIRTSKHQSLVPPGVKLDPPKNVPVDPAFIPAKREQILKSILKDKDVDIEDEEIRASLVSLAMEKILRRSSVEVDSIKNFIAIDGGANTAFLSNLVFNKNDLRIQNKEGKWKNKIDFNDITNLELSNMVPFAELYTIKHGSHKGKRTYMEIPYAFDDYTQKIKLDAMFYDRTSRGGEIGIKSVEWKSLATNMSNQALVEAKIKIHIQDIQDITTGRGGVTLLDFLYPAGASNPMFDTKSFNIKLKVGWKYRKEGNETLDELETKVKEKNLSEVLYLTLTNHRFEFDENGSVELTIDYMGMIESELSDQNTKNILDKLSPFKKVIERQIKFWKSLLSATLKENATYNDFYELATNQEAQLAGFVFELRTDFDAGAGHTEDIWIATIKAANNIGDSEAKKLWEKVKNLQTTAILPSDYEFYEPNILGASILTNKKGKTTKNNEWFGKVKYIIKIPENTSGDGGFLEGLGDIVTLLLDSAAANAKQGGYVAFDLKDSGGLKKYKQNIEEKIAEQEKKLRASYAAALSNLFADPNTNVRFITVSKESADALRDLSSYQNINLVSEFNIVEETITEALEGIKIENFDNKKQNAKVGEILKSSGKQNQPGIDISKFRENLLNNQGKSGSLNLAIISIRDIISYYINLVYGTSSQERSLPDDLKLVFGSFSYTNFGNTVPQNLISGLGGASQKNSVGYEGRSFERKYALISDMWISVDSFISWYNSHVIDTNLKKMSFLEFIRSLFNNIIPANLKNNLVPFAPNRSVVVSYNFYSTEKIPERKLKENSYNYGNSNRKAGFPQTNAESLYRYKYGYNFGLPVDDDIIVDLLSKNPLYKLRKKAKKQDFTISSNSKLDNFLFIFAKNEKDERLESDYSKDIFKGIYHFYIGHDKGLVKDIKFTRQDNNLLESANIKNANNADSGNVIIRQIYNAEITLFGNTFFTPGTLIHITPTYPGTRLRNPTLYMIGLGGYFLINEISSYIEDNKFETKIKAQWQMHGGGYEGKINPDTIRLLKG